MKFRQKSNRDEKNIRGDKNVALKSDPKGKKDIAQLSLEVKLENGAPLFMFPAEVIDALRRSISRLISKKTLPARLSLVAALRQEGVTYLSRAMALTMANDLDTSVCAVELNWWWPDRTLPLPAENLGLAGVLAEEITLKQAIVRTSQPNLAILPAGKLAVANRPIYARGAHLKEILYQLNEQFEYLVLDIPAISVTNDAIPLAALGDACCLVVHQGVTPVEKVRTALEEIDEQKVLGVVMNNVRTYTPPFLLNMIPQDATAETRLATV